MDRLYSELGALVRHQKSAEEPIAKDLMLAYGRRADVLPPDAESGEVLPDAI